MISSEKDGPSVQMFGAMKLPSEVIMVDYGFSGASSVPT